MRRTSRFKSNSTSRFKSGVVKTTSIKYKNNLLTSSSYGSNWPLVSESVKKRDNYRCRAHVLGLRKCTNVFPPPFSHLLHAHHIISRNKLLLTVGYPQCDHPKYLITLCNECHGLLHGKYLGSISSKQKQAAKKVAFKGV